MNRETNTAKLEDFLQANIFEIIKNSDRALVADIEAELDEFINSISTEVEEFTTEITQQVNEVISNNPDVATEFEALINELEARKNDLIEVVGEQETNFDTMLNDLEARKDTLVEVPGENLDTVDRTVSENAAEMTSNLLENETNSTSEEFETQEVENKESGEIEAEEENDDRDDDKDGDKDKDSEIEDKQDKNGDRDGEVKDKDGDRDKDRDKDKDGDGDGEVKDKDGDRDKDGDKDKDGDRDGDGEVKDKDGDRDKDRDKDKDGDRDKDGDKDKDGDGDGDGREIEIEGINKAIAFLEKNDIFNLPKDISEVSIEVETGKKGLNKLLQNQQFNEILAKAGLPTGEQLKRKLKGDEVEIDKEIKLPDGSTLSIELEGEEGEIEFSLEIEREDDDDRKGNRNSSGIGLQQIASNVLGFLADANPRNLANVLANEVGINPSAIEDLGDLISGETSLSEIISDLGGSQIRKLADFALKPLQEAFGVVPDQVISFLGEQIGLDTEQISQVTDVLSGEAGIDTIIGSDASDLLFGGTGVDNLLGFRNPFGGFVPFADSFEQITIINSLIQGAKDGEVFGKSVKLDNSFFNAWDNVFKLAVEFYEQIKDGNWSAVNSNQFEDWRKKLNTLQQEFAATGADRRGSTGLFNRLEQFNPTDEGQWKDFYQQLVVVANLIIGDRRVIPLSDAQIEDYRQRFSDVLNFTPFVGDIKGVTEAITGRDSITDTELKPWERALGAIPLFGGVLRQVTKTAAQSELLVKLSDNVYGIFRGAKDELDKLIKNFPGLGSADEYVDVVTPDGQVFRVPKEEEYKNFLEVSSSTPPGGGGRFSSLPNNIQNKINELEDFEKNQYVKILNQSGTIGQRARELILSQPIQFTRIEGSFDPATNFENFRQVLTELPTIRDVNKFKDIFDSNYFQNTTLLSASIIERHETLLKNIIEVRSDFRGTVAKNVNYKTAIVDRLEVLSEVKNIRESLYTALGGRYNAKGLRLKGKNIAFGSYQIKSPDGKEISSGDLELLAPSGQVSTKLIEELRSANQLGSNNTFGGRKIVPDIDESAKFKPIDIEGRNPGVDSERKMLEYILKDMENQFGRTFNISEVYRGFTGQVNINSEFLPCDSCKKIIQEQFGTMFPDIQINVSYGTGFD